MSALNILDPLIELFSNNHDSNECNQSTELITQTTELIKDCLLLRDVFSVDEQYQLYQAILKAGSYSKQSKNKNSTVTQLMKIIPKNKHHQCRLSPIYDTLFNRTFDILCQTPEKFQTIIPKKESLIKRHMKALNYRAPNGSISRHCDNEKGWVLLYSIGCIANFFVGYKSKEKGTEFEFNSGDILLFNGSRRSGIYHGVDSIVDSSNKNFKFSNR